MIFILRTTGGRFKKMINVKTNINFSNLFYRIVYKYHAKQTIKCTHKPAQSKALGSNPKVDGGWAAIEMHHCVVHIMVVIFYNN